MSSHLQRGKAAEDAAARFLVQKGYSIVYRNYRYRRGEIDLIASKGSLLVFVEVKMRSSASFGYPEQAVDRHKRQIILQTAEQFMHTTSLLFSLVRFDIIAVLGNGPDRQITHFEDAFY